MAEEARYNKRIHADLPQILRPGGEFFMEIGADQGRP